MQLVLEFFVVFARFEYALKEAGYFRCHRDRIAADWTKFSSANNEAFRKQYERNEQTKLLIDGFNTLAPRVHRCNSHDGLYWGEQNDPQGTADLDATVQSLKTIRNNLFHGSKNALLPEGPQGHRDEKLLKSALEVLYALVGLNHDVKSAFLRF